MLCKFFATAKTVDAGAMCHSQLLISRVGQNHIYTVYIRYFRQENHQIYGHIRFWPTLLIAVSRSKPLLCGQIKVPTTLSSLLWPPCCLPRTKLHKAQQLLSSVCNTWTKVFVEQQIDISLSLLPLIFLFLVNTAILQRKRIRTICDRSLRWSCWSAIAAYNSS
jgi:hypothetical protein